MGAKTTYLAIFTFAVLLIIIISNIKKCEGVKEEIKTTIDTLYIKGKIDTVYFPKTVIKTKGVIIDRIDTVYIDSVKAYNYTTLVDDSLISGSIFTVSTGKVLSNDLEYIPKFPKYINRVDTLRINKETTTVINPYEFYIGTGIGGNTAQFIFEPSLALRTPKKTIFTASYDVINKTYKGGAYIRIFKK